MGMAATGPHDSIERDAIMASWGSKRKDAMSTLTDEFDRKLAELKHAIDLRLSSIEDEMSDFGKQLRIKGGKAVNQVESKVHEQPLAALAIAAGVGFVAAHLLRRRKSS